MNFLVHVVSLADTKRAC